MKKMLLVLVLLVPFAAFADDIKETVHVVIIGGPNAGTYDGATNRSGCSAGLTGPGSFGNQFSLPKEKDPKRFNSLQLNMPKANAAHDFYLSVGFGPLLQRSAEYVVDTKKGKGSGTVSVADHGATAKVTFDAKTADGVKLTGTIDCHSVMRAR
jgi:hypothetical protein